MLLLVLVLLSHVIITTSTKNGHITHRSQYTVSTDALSTRDFMNGAAEAPDGSYVLAFGHTGGKRTILKLNPASAWFIAFGYSSGG